MVEHKGKDIDCQNNCVMLLEFISVFAVRTAAAKGKKGLIDNVSDLQRQ
jgi:hypothetical protein